MIHGNVLVNSKQIGYWSARRKTRAAETGQVAEYDCIVELAPDRDVHGKAWPKREWTGTVQHEVGLGALSLMQTVLGAAEASFRQRGLY